MVKVLRWIAVLPAAVVAASELRVLLICCMLRIIGFDNVRINDTLNKCSSDLVKPLELL